MAKQPTQKQPPDWSGFASALADVLKWRSGQGVAIALIGGLAVGVHATPRATKDIDITVATNARPATLLASLADCNFVPAFAESAEIAAISGVLPLRHSPSGAVVDLIFARFAYQQDMVDRAVTLKVSGLAVPVVQVDDLCFLKLIAARPQDIADTVAVLKANQGIDRAALLSRVQSFAELVEQPELLDSARAILMPLNDDAE
ncbi:MAG: hypothetical protein KF696_15980 [Planctomycetes bacterium]|nr:hypothetical protein [Planctomycetota bacterium]MCW8136923.1 hypothetical protein [Planctomycetota bacterium]